MEWLYKFSTLIIKVNFQLQYDKIHMQDILVSYLYTRSRHLSNIVQSLAMNDENIPNEPVINAPYNLKQTSSKFVPSAIFTAFVAS